jgi:hypothetical protein
MTFFVHSITIDCSDWTGLVKFWAAASDFQEDAENPNEPGDPVGMLVSPDGRLQLLFIPVPEPKKVKNRIHLDVIPTDGTRDEEVERLLGLGAMLVDDRRNDDGTGWAVLADPEGNEFCVERSAAERDS